MTDEVTQDVKDIIKEVQPYALKGSPELRLREDLNWCSLDVFELISLLEKQFQFDVSLEDAKTITTVQSIFDLVQSKMDAKVK